MPVVAARETTQDGEPAAGARRGGGQRADIQGLRAVAVGLVLVYHLRPDWLPGGFAGVDVFFVISGFLIIGTLAGEVRRTGRVRLVDFYARRIRRLLPAASVVLLATVLATLLLMPIGRWPGILREVAASALDVQNWVLAVFSADYAHATSAASPVQHFWSLSVEEQFYLVIPLLLLVSAVLTRRAGRTGAGAFIAVAVVTAASLAYSVAVTEAPPNAAYFITPTRVWELGIGGLVAMSLHRIRPGRAGRFLLGWAGLAAVAYSAFALTTAQAFPGWIALVPTLGTAAMLVAGARQEAYPRAVPDVPFLLGLQPLRYLGDISYSLYLWHWPVIVFALERSGTDQLDRVQVLAVGALSLVLAAVSKHAIEDPFRKRGRARRKLAETGRRPFRLRLRATYLLGATLVTMTLVAATVPWQVAQERLDASFAVATLDGDHPGAQALDPVAPVHPRPGVPLSPDPAVADRDVAAPWLDNCGSYDLAKPVSGDACAYGNPKATKTMVLVGDSHATQFSTALIDFATRDQTWRVKVMVHDGCAFGDLPPDEAGYPLKVCADKAYEMLPILLDAKPDLVVTSGYTLGSKVVDGRRTWPERARILDGYRALLGPLAEAGIPVAAIRDVPLMTANTPRCLQRNPDSPHTCDTSRDAALGRELDPLVEAVTGLPGTRVADLTDWLCTADTCPAVIGNVVVYRDNHLTDTYVRSLQAPLITQLGLETAPK